MDVYGKYVIFCEGEGIRPIPCICDQDITDPQQTRCDAPFHRGCTDDTSELEFITFVHSYTRYDEYILARQKWYEKNMGP